MYKILHIPSGHYIYALNKEPMLYVDINEAKTRIKMWCDPEHWDGGTYWNNDNADIGYILQETEFEIIRGVI
jgi:hypothetical protein